MNIYLFVSFSTLKSIRRDQQYRTLLSQYNISDVDILLLDKHSSDSHSFTDLTVPNPLTPLTPTTPPTAPIQSANIDTTSIHNVHSMITQPVPSTPVKGPQTGINTPLPSSSTTAAAAAARANTSMINNSISNNNSSESNTQRVYVREEPSEMATPVTNHIGIAQRNNRDDNYSTSSTTTHTTTPTTTTNSTHTLNKSHSHTGVTLITTPLTQKQGPKPEKTVDQKALKSSQSERILSLHTPYNNSSNKNVSDTNSNNTDNIDSRGTTPMINISKQVWVNTPESNYNNNNKSTNNNGNNSTTPPTSNTTNNNESKRLFSSAAETLFTAAPETPKSTSASVHTELETHAPQSKILNNSSNNRRISNASDITVQQYQHQQQPYPSAIPLTPDIPTRRPETYHALKSSSTASVDVNSTASTAEVYNKPNQTSSNTTAALSLSTSTRPIDRTSSNTTSIPSKTSKTATTSTTSTLHTPSSATTTTTTQPSKNTPSFTTSAPLAVESLLFHTSDYHVKPIVDNRLIETIQIPPLKQYTTTSTTTNNSNSNSIVKLNYPIFSSETLSNMSYDDISTHIMCIYKQLSKCTPTSAAMRTVSSGISGHNSYQTNQLNERCYILTYLLSLSSIKDVANTVVNSHLLGCLLRSIQQTPPVSSLTPTSTPTNTTANNKTSNGHNNNNNNNSASRIPTAVSSTNQLSTQYTLITECRHLAATILAYAIRFATYIPILHNRDDHIISSIVPVILSNEGRSVSDVKLRRRLMAALGELSFYISSQELTTTAVGGGATSAGGSTAKETTVTPTTSKLTSSSSSQQQQQQQQQPYSDKSDRTDKSTKVSATTSNLSPEGGKEKEKEVVWSIHSSVVDAFEAVLCEEGGGDEVTLHYACKVSHVLHGLLPCTAYTNIVL